MNRTTTFQNVAARRQKITDLLEWLEERRLMADVSPTALAEMDGRIELLRMQLRELEADHD